MGLYRSAFNLSLFAALAAVLVPPAAHLVKVGGLFLTPTPTVLGEGQGPIYIEDTVHCEDVHHYLPANLLFTACEDSKSTRFDWFPGLGHLTPRPEARGSIHVVNPQVSCPDGVNVELLENTLLTLYNADHEVEAAGIRELRGPVRDARHRRYRGP